MKTHNIKIQYHDFHPSQATQNFVASVMEELAQELPNGSEIKATFHEKEKLMKGMLQIHSYGGPFFSVVTADNLHLVIVKLVAQIRRRVEKFKSKQHRRDGLKSRLRRQQFEGETLEQETAS